MGRPIVEVMAEAHYNARHGLGSWNKLAPELRAKEMMPMVDVARVFKAFGLVEPDEVLPQVAALSRPRGLTNTPLFTGRPCPECESLNTVQNGKCLLCMECKATGECG